MASSLRLAQYQQSTRALAAKASVPFAAAAAATLLPSFAHAQAIAVQLSTPAVASVGHSLYIDFKGFSISGSNVDFYNASIKVHDSIQADTIYSSFSMNRGVLGTVRSAGSDFANNFAPSTLIDASLFSSINGSGYFNTYFGTVLTPTWASATGYIGLMFNDPDTSSSYYGWAKISTNANASQISLLAFGYNQTPGTGIRTGEGLAPVPEPATSAALLALGAAGLVAYRRRKNLARAV